MPCSETAPTGHKHLASHLPACRGMGGRSRMRFCSHTTSMPTATGPGVRCERSHGTAGKAKRTLRAPCRRAACLGRRRRRVDQSSGPCGSRRGHPHHAVGKPRSLRECRDHARWLVCFVWGRIYVCGQISTQPVTERTAVIPLRRLEALAVQCVVFAPGVKRRSAQPRRRAVWRCRCAQLMAGQN